jgi:hypothetical protein
LNNIDIKTNLKIIQLRQSDSQRFQNLENPENSLGVGGYDFNNLPPSNSNNSSSSENLLPNERMLI